ncbi:MAG: DUF3298 domain-containing protein [Candidatus Sumerlaeota bacterium]|nr:DUF3298 domain-containing protein [Candidatus Sumerlaeota bacterium]
MKRIHHHYGSIRAVALGIAAVLYLADGLIHSRAEQADGSQQTPASKSGRTTSNVKVTTHTIQKTEDFGTIDVNYPEIINAPKEVNKKIEGMAKAIIADFKRKATEEVKLRREAVAEWNRTMLQDARTSVSESEMHVVIDLELTLGYQVAQVSDDYISLLLTGYEYCGGVHGMPIYQSFNYDLKKRKEVNLADLFPKDADYLKKVSAFCNSDLLKTMKESSSDNRVDTIWVGDGVAPKAKNFEIFTFTRDSITIIFPPYQVACFAAGTFEVEMPRK